jgi:flagellar biosynthesis protein FlhG
MIESNRFAAEYASGLRPTAVPMLKALRGAAKRRNGAPVFAVTSGKGGVGKTNVVANVAIALARRQHRVMIIDADLGLANLDLYLGLKPARTLADFFSGSATLDEIVITNRDGILVMPGASGVQEITRLRPEQKNSLLTALDAVTDEIDLVLLDTASGISDMVTYFTGAAHEIIVVVTPEPSSMTDAYALMKVLALQQRQTRFLMLANNVSDADEARRLFDTLSSTALRFLNVSLDLLGWIPRDPLLLCAAARAGAVIRDYPDAPSARAFTRLADKLVERADERGKVTGNVQFFLRRMLETGKVDQ